MEAQAGLGSNSVLAQQAGYEALGRLLCLSLFLSVKWGHSLMEKCIQAPSQSPLPSESLGDSLWAADTSYTTLRPSPVPLSLAHHIYVNQEAPSPGTLDVKCSPEGHRPDTRDTDSGR